MPAILKRSKGEGFGGEGLAFPFNLLKSQIKEGETLEPAKELRAVNPVMVPFDVGHSWPFCQSKA
jgi:hypothetical protein